jgi:hypothetical protein
MTYALQLCELSESNEESRLQSIRSRCSSLAMDICDDAGDVFRARVGELIASHSSELGPYGCDIGTDLIL